MPVERQRWVPCADVPTINARMPRIVEVLDKSIRYDIQPISASALVALTFPRTLLLVTTSGGSVTLTLPPAASVVGMRLETKKLTAANTLTLDADGSETIDGAATLAWTTQYQAYSIVSDGAVWHVV